MSSPPRLRLALFGAGARGLQCLGTLAGNSQVDVVALFDNDARKWGTTVQGLPVLEPTLERCRGVDAILLASIHAREILAQLTRLGVDDRVVLSPPHLQRRLSGLAPPPLPDETLSADEACRCLLAAVSAVRRERAAALDADPPPRRSAAWSGEVACTICGNNYIAYATVLARSFLRHHPDGRFFLCLVDRRRPDVRYPDDPRIVVIEAAQLGMPAFDAQAFKYDVLEFNTAVKPWFLQWIFRAHGAERVLYLDPDILVLDRLDPLFDALAATPLLLTPHLLAPYRDDHHPREIDILRAGTFNLGFLGLAAHQQTWDLLAWWQHRLADGCTRQVERGYFVDQKWMDLAPSFFPAYAIVRDPGCNAAYWNLHERTIAADGDGFTVNGRPLRFFHFSGIDVHDLDSVSKHQTRWALPADGALRDLFEIYRLLLLAHRHLEWRRMPYDYGRFDNGVAIPDVVRVLYRESRLATAYPHPFAAGPASFFAWLCASWSGSPRISNAIAALRAREPAASPSVADDQLTELLDAQALAERYHLPDVLVAPAATPAAPAPSTSSVAAPTRWSGPRMVGPDSPTLGRLVGVGLNRASALATSRQLAAADLVIPYWYADTLSASVPAGTAEIWAPSTAAAGRLAAAGTQPAVYVPVPVGVVTPSSRSRSALGLADAGRLLVAVSDPLTRDHHDLVATARLFVAAQLGATSEATLVVASPAGDDSSEDTATRAAMAAVGLRWLSLPVEDLLQLLRLADGYLSLYDGVVADPWLAEALNYGCPVVVTHSLGTTDVATVNNSFLLATDAAADGRPDRAAAVAALRAVVAEPDQARERGARGRRDLRESHGLDAVAAVIGRRLVRFTPHLTAAVAETA